MVLLPGRNAVMIAVVWRGFSVTVSLTTDESDTVQFDATKSERK
jgi:hypothetical protein